MNRPDRVLVTHHFALLREALHIVEQEIGTPQDVDIAAKENFDRRLAFAGPFEMEEIQPGWDLMLTIVKVVLLDLSASPEPPPALVRQVEKGDVGRQTPSLAETTIWSRT